ncbi:unnamed protein product [Linum trigynum]|uniref:Uncharacterized protein n=1 Tax=Linum trigynum TaxID=586398 RepID=A0AAV2EV29_9ROSI
MFSLPHPSIVSISPRLRSDSIPCSRCPIHQGRFRGNHHLIEEHRYGGAKTEEKEDVAAFCTPSFSPEFRSLSTLLVNAILSKIEPLPTT